ncbi:hypothetical protein D9611_012828 [Ephemerocybe angulata]|uniref:Uncharacterized protein n=1 Tax=Ephemerocybe angulata TaxID=980116 RepID=A0A8H5BAU3_9AGAR|nr:hypothetical protein D9611_012828 [Tulosesus angulatus]
MDSKGEQSTHALRHDPGSRPQRHGHRSQSLPSHLLHLWETRHAVPDVSCAYCKAKGHKIADCKSPNKKPFAPFAKDTTAPPQYTRVNDFDLSAMPESEIEALKAKLKDF